MSFNLENDITALTTAIGYMQIESNMPVYNLYIYLLFSRIYVASSPIVF